MTGENGETAKQDDGRLAAAVALSVAVAMPLWRAVLPGLQYSLMPSLQRAIGFDVGYRLAQYVVLILLASALALAVLLAAREIAAGQGRVITPVALLALAALLLVYQYGTPPLRLLASLLSLPAAVVAWGGLANRAAGTAAGRERFVTGWFAGLLLDLLLRYMSDTYDLSWQANTGARLFIGALALAGASAALLSWPARTAPLAGALLPGTVWVALPLAAYVALAGTQDVGALAVSLPRSLPGAALLSAGYLLIAWAVARGLAGRPGAAESAAALMVIALAVVGPSWETLVIASLGAAASGLAIAAVLADPVDPRVLRRVYRGGTAFCGMFAACIAIWLGGEPRESLDPTGPSLDGLWAGVVLLGACRMTRPAAVAEPSRSRAGYVGVVGALLVALSIFPAQARAGSDRPIGDTFKAMTLNARRGFNRQGAFTLERIAALIERERADVVGLQQISRARKSEGGVDELAWLAERLNMDSAFVATEGPGLGLGLLSRARIQRPRAIPFSAGGYRTGTLLAADLQATPRLTAVVADLAAAPEVRRLQSAQLAAATVPGDTVLMADLQIDAPSPSVSPLLDPDRWADGFRPGPQGGLTFPTDFPTMRRDVIYFRGSLRAGEGSVINEIPPVSSHRAVVVRFHR